MSFLCCTFYVILYSVWVFYQRLCNCTNTGTNKQFFVVLRCSSLKAFDFDLVLLAKFLSELTKIIAITYHRNYINMSIDIVGLKSIDFKFIQNHFKQFSSEDSNGILSKKREKYKRLMSILWQRKLNMQ